MKNIFSILLIWFWVQITSAQTTARVVRVKDADTFVLNAYGRLLTIRLGKVDAPETKQNYGQQAQKKVSALLLGKIVNYDSTGHDRYGRVIAGIRIDWRRLDSIEIVNGWAWHYLQYDKEQMLEQLMAQAATNKVGLWQCGKENVWPPWIYRSYNYNNRLRYCKGCSTNN